MDSNRRRTENNDDAVAADDDDEDDRKSDAASALVSIAESVSHSHGKVAARNEIALGSNEIGPPGEASGTWSASTGATTASRRFGWSKSDILAASTEYFPSKVPKHSEPGSNGKAAMEVTPSSRDAQQKMSFAAPLSGDDQSSGIAKSKRRSSISHQERMDSMTPDRHPSQVPGKPNKSLQ